LRAAYPLELAASIPAIAPSLMQSLVVPYEVRRFLSFFFNDTAPTEIYTLSLHDALPIYLCFWEQLLNRMTHQMRARVTNNFDTGDRKSTRLNFSHVKTSYAVFCLKKKKKKTLHKDKIQTTALHKTNKKHTKPNTKKNTHT